MALLTQHKVAVVLLTQREAAGFLCLSERTLERARVTGEGPPFAKLGKRVLYRRSDLEEWINARICQSTSERPNRGLSNSTVAANPAKSAKRTGKDGSPQNAEQGGAAQGRGSARIVG